MKKTVIALVVLISILISACGSEKNETATSEPGKNRVEISESEDNSGYFLNEFNSDDKLIKSTKYSNSDVLLWYTEYTLDSGGDCRQSSTYDSDGTILCLVFYDAFGNAIESMLFEYDGSNLKKLTEFNIAGNVYRQTEHTSFSATTTLFNNNGQVVEVAKYGTLLESPATFQEYIYDINGNNTELRVYNADGTLNRREIAEFDQYNRELTRTQYDSLGTIISKTKNSFDSSGKIAKSVETGYGGKNIRLYDENERVIKWSWYDQNGNLEDTEIFEYDNLGREILYEIYDSNGVKYSWSVTEYIGDVCRRTTFDNNGMVDEVIEN